MTIGEARYVVENREYYDQRTYMWAVEILENAEKQGMLDELPDRGDA